MISQLTDFKSRGLTEWFVDASGWTLKWYTFNFIKLFQVIWHLENCMLKERFSLLEPIRNDTYICFDD